MNEEDRGKMLRSCLDKRMLATLGTAYPSQGRQYTHLTPRIVAALGEIQALSQIELPLLPTEDLGTLDRSDVTALYRMLRTVYLAELVFGDAGRARDWLCAPKRRLRGRVPLLIAGHLEHAHRLEHWLMEIDEGCRL